DAFNVRFDMYKGSLSYSAAYAPSVNVRKGFNTTGNWCGNADKSTPYYTTQPDYTNPIVVTTGNTQSGSANARKQIINVPAADITKLLAGTATTPTAGGRMIADPSNVKIPVGTNVNSASGT